MGVRQLLRMLEVVQRGGEGRSWVVARSSPVVLPWVIHLEVEARQATSCPMGDTPAVGLERRDTRVPLARSRSLAEREVREVREAWRPWHRRSTRVELGDGVVRPGRRAGIRSRPGVLAQLALPRSLLARGLQAALRSSVVTRVPRVGLRRRVGRRSLVARRAEASRPRACRRGWGWEGPSAGRSIVTRSFEIGRIAASIH
jgi:hypothetical protein